MVKKLILINPFSEIHQGPGNIQKKYPPLGLGIVAACTPENWEIKIIDENFDLFSYEEADLIGITAFTSQINRAYQIAKKYVLNETPVVIGGQHASFMPNEALRYCTSVFIGEAESAWPRLVKDFDNNKLRETYYGGLADLSKSQPPRRDLFHPDYLLSSVQSSRGCPYNCEFCSETVFYGSKFRIAPISVVVDEIQSIQQELFWFVDNNLFGNSKREQNRAKELFREMIERGIRKKWFCFANMQPCTDRELLSLAEKAGCRMVFLEVAAENDQFLNEVGKKNQEDLYLKVFEMLHEVGISVLAGIMIGMENDTVDSIMKRIDFILEKPIDSYRVAVTTPLPGSRIFNKMIQEKRILKNNFPLDWDYYNWKYPVYKHKLIKEEIFGKVINEAYQKLYNPNTISQKYMQTLKNTNNIELAEISRLTNIDIAGAFIHP